MKAIDRWIERKLHEQHPSIKEAVTIAEEYKKVTGGRSLYAQITLSAIPSPSFSFQSKAHWPRESYDEDVIIGILDVLLATRNQNGGPAGRGKKVTAAKVRQATATSLPATGLAKVTLYVRPDQVVAIEAIQLQERRRTGIRPDKSALVQEGLDLLIRKYAPKP